MSKVRKQFILEAAKIQRVRKILGALTDTDAVDQALTLVLTNARLWREHARVIGKCRLRNMDQSRSHG